MSKLNDQEDYEIRKIIYSFDIPGLEKRIRKYRAGKIVCFILFLISLGYFTYLKINENYPMDLVAIFMPLCASAVFWWREKDLKEAKKILLDPEYDTERQNQAR